MAKRLTHWRLAYKVAWRVKPFAMKVIRKKSLRETLKEFLGLIVFAEPKRQGS